MRSRSGRVSGMTLNAAVLAFLDFGSGGAVGGASVSASSRVATAGSLGHGREPMLRAGQTEKIIATRVAVRPDPASEKTPLGDGRTGRADYSGPVSTPVRAAHGRARL